MKKGLFTLVLVCFVVVGMVGFAANPEFWGIPDIIIGDQEDIGVTDNYFVFSDAFAFADYFHWTSGGVKTGLKWHYVQSDSVTGDGIAINLSTVSASVDITGGGAETDASFQNIIISPIGGPNNGGSLPADSTDAVVVSLQLNNFLLKDDQDVTVFTDDGGFDAYTSEYYYTPAAGEDFAANPGWIDRVADPIPPLIGVPAGITNGVHAYNSTSDCYTIATTGLDNVFGHWQMPANSIDIIPGAAYVFTAELFVKPVGVSPIDEEAGLWTLYGPQIRLRINAQNESIGQEALVQSTGSGDLALTSDAAAGFPNATSETFVFDPRDHSAYVGFGTDNLYFSMDLVDFIAGTGSERDDEGLIGISELDVATFPIKMLAKEATTAQSYPRSEATLGAEIDEYNAYATGFGGTPMAATTDAANSLLLVSNGVAKGFAFYDLINSYGIGVDDTNKNKWFWFQFEVAASSQSIDWIRLRVQTNDAQRVVLYNLRGQFAGGYQLPGGSSLFETYNVIMCGQDEMLNRRISFSFDHIDFYEGEASLGNGTAILKSVKALTVDPPTLSP